MNVLRRSGALLLVSSVAVVSLLGCGGEEPEAPESERVTPTGETTADGPATDLGRFDEVLIEPFCDLAVPGLTMPNTDRIEYGLEQVDPDDNGTTVEYVCQIAVNDETAFTAAEAGLEYVTLRLVMAIANDDSEGARTLPQIPEPFDAESTDWDETVVSQQEQSLTLECPEQASCAGETVSITEYRATFEARHRNMYLGISARFHSPAGPVDPVDDPQTYLRELYVDYVSSLIETLPRAG